MYSWQRKISLKMIVRASVAAGLLLFGTARSEAASFSIQSVLTGDPRTANPDNILVRLGIVGDTTSSQTFWTVNLDSAAYHPDMVLGGFFFNLGVDPTTVMFSNFSPVAWDFSYNSNPKTADGSGGAAFAFYVKDPSGNENNITNTVNLTFTATLRNGQLWSTAMFTGAPLSDGDGILDPGAQVGAHLRSLSMAGCATCTTDSGFASGNYGNTTTPEPASLLLLGGGGAVLAAVRRRRLSRQ